MKEQIWLPNENICDCQLTLNNTFNYLTTDNDRTQQFYLLPKIHKDTLNPPGRPIVSGSGGPTEKISQLVDHFIGKIVPLSKSYVRDSTHLINILKRFYCTTRNTIVYPGYY